MLPWQLLSWSATRLLQMLEVIFNIDMFNRKSRREEGLSLRLQIQIRPAQRNRMLVIKGVNGPSEGEP